MSDSRRIDISEVGDVTIAKFIDKKILDETNIAEIGNQLFGLVDEDGRKRIILDFTVVEYLSSAALGKMITMDKNCLLYTSPSPRDLSTSRMPSSA